MLIRHRWRGGQRRIGLTGGIATGKSSVGRFLAERHGLPVLDADRYAREALAPCSQGEQAVLERYGDRVRHATGGIDRAALGRIVFADGAERAWLEALIHPLVRARFDADLARLAAAPVVVMMIPLLFEAGLEGLCSEVWLVDCDEGQQLKRLIARDRLSEAEARARVATQWPLERKRQLADLVIDNQGAATSLAERVKEAVEVQTPCRAETTRSTQASGPSCPESTVRS
ncbi:dephospho-CoA kinase [Synechococcus sp. BA-124 BA4]|uniref:dephospho-CoA kinase n=1 Tax=unclassified Synechococcus TaxID=2626047 RepID=UPI002AD31925|nr:MULTISPECIES: dephospho-CoA kinase [unclassified Synechococcus]MEA5401099.1 dephospho-CoA kinase [Synechococcus sp. BA-124 BA4]